jgi:hypothetical protein
MKTTMNIPSNTLRETKRLFSRLKYLQNKPPVIAFDARYLADALEIGSTLCLIDETSPGICRHPTGRFCVVMPMRLAIPAEETSRKAPVPGQPAKAVA